MHGHIPARWESFELEDLQEQCFGQLHVFENYINNYTIQYTTILTVGCDVAGLGSSPTIGYFQTYIHRYIHTPFEVAGMQSVVVAVAADVDDVVAAVVVRCMDTDTRVHMQVQKVWYGME